MIAPEPLDPSEDEEALRDEVAGLRRRGVPFRTYLSPGLGINARADLDFSRRLASRGWVGMSIPRSTAAPARTAVERFVVVEELLAPGHRSAPTGSATARPPRRSWRFGTEEHKREFLPRIVPATCLFCLGMSEPDSGSDLASVRTRATSHRGRVAGHRHEGVDVGRALRDYAVTLCRTRTAEAGKHAGCRS